MNYTIISSQEGLVLNNNKMGWATIDIGHTTRSIEDIAFKVITAKVMECISGSISETERDLYGDNSFQQVEDTLLQSGSTFVDNSIFPSGTYGIDPSCVSSDATTYNLNDNQLARLACAVYLRKAGNFVQVIVSANETSFQNALSHYQISIKLKDSNN